MENTCEPFCRWRKKWVHFLESVIQNSMWYLAAYRRFSNLSELTNKGNETLFPDVHWNIFHFFDFQLRFCMCAAIFFTFQKSTVRLGRLNLTDDRSATSTLVFRMYYMRSFYVEFHGVCAQIRTCTSYTLRIFLFRAHENYDICPIRMRYESDWTITYSMRTNGNLD